MTFIIPLCIIIILVLIHDQVNQIILGMFDSQCAPESISCDHTHTSSRSTYMNSDSDSGHCSVLKLTF